MPGATEYTPLREELDAAISEVSAAEEALGIALSELRAGARAEKVTVTASIEAAFERVRSSRAALARVRTLMDDA
jgi:hypothetical protein